MLLRDRYNTPGRYYHTWHHHIEDCMRQWNEVLNTTMRLTDIEMLAVEQAIMWHDVIYFAGSPDNEINSAIAYLTETGDHPVLRREVYRLIMLTKSHVVEHPHADLAGSIMVSIDLASIGYAPSVFNTNTDLLRLEASHLTDEEWGASCSKFFASLLMRDTIYPYAPFRERYEQQARENLQSGIRRFQG